MPSNFLSLDEFPTFTGEESTKEQIQALHNYLFIMRQQLQYMLQNLSIENWNATALQTLTNGTQEQFVSTLQTVSAQLSQMKNQIDSFSGRLSGMESVSGRVGQLETETAALTAWAAEHEDKTGGLPQRMTAAESEIGALQQSHSEMSSQIVTQGQQIQSNEISIGELDDQLNAQGGLAAVVASLQAVVTALQGSVGVLESIVQKTDAGAAVGEDGKELHLLGKVYINEMLIG